MVFYVFCIKCSSQTSFHLSDLFGERYVVTGIAGMKIAMWLCIYNEYFKKQVRKGQHVDKYHIFMVHIYLQVASEILLNVMKKYLCRVFEEPIISLFAFFLCPHLVVPDVKEKEPLYSLFFLHSSESTEGLFCTYRDEEHILNLTITFAVQYLYSIPNSNSKRINVVLCLVFLVVY